MKNRSEDPDLRIAELVAAGRGRLRRRFKSRRDSLFFLPIKREMRGSSFFRPRTAKRGSYSFFKSKRSKTSFPCSKNPHFPRNHTAPLPRKKDTPLYVRRNISSDFRSVHRAQRSKMRFYSIFGLEDRRFKIEGSSFSGSEDRG